MSNALDEIAITADIETTFSEGEDACLEAMIKAAPYTDHKTEQSQANSRNKLSSRKGIFYEIGCIMKRGIKRILPVWITSAVILTLLVPLYAAYSLTIVDDSSVQPGALINGQPNLVSVASRKLNFIDLDEGSLSIINADTGTQLLLINKGEHGSVRSVLRGLIRERKAQSIGSDIAFELVLWRNGLLSLIDPATSRRVELSAFGNDNVAVFSRLLPPNTVNAGLGSLWL